MKLVLTGSIGMGKSTVAKMFRDAGVEIWSADDVVKSLYAQDFDLRAFLKQTAPDVFEVDAVNFEKVNFKKWRTHIHNDPKILLALETIIHPKVRDHRVQFLDGEGVKLCEIPLYFETGKDGNFDYVIVVSADFETQKSRVLARPNITKKDFEMILLRQIPDAKKRAQADFIIRTDCTLEETRAQVHNLLKTIGFQNA